MGKQEVIDIIRSSKPEIVSRYGVERLGLFGYEPVAFTVFLGKIPLPGII